MESEGGARQVLDDVSAVAGSVLADANQADSEHRLREQTVVPRVTLGRDCPSPEG
jgi:hypothetical protein